jgi:hypothetical protein
VKVASLPHNKKYNKKEIKDEGKEEGGGGGMKPTRTKPEGEAGIFLNLLDGWIESYFY